MNLNWPLLHALLAATASCTKAPGDAYGTLDPIHAATIKAASSPDLVAHTAHLISTGHLRTLPDRDILTPAGESLLRDLGTPENLAHVLAHLKETNTPAQGHRVRALARRRTLATARAAASSSEISNLKSEIFLPLATPSPEAATIV